MKSLKAQRTRSLLGASLFLLLAIIGCSGSATPIDVHGFSNLVLKDDTLWFGAGYKLYRVDLNQQTAKVVYDTDDVVITFVEIDEESLFFGGHHSPNGSEGVIWSLDINSETIVWEKNIQDNWWRGRIVASPLIDQDTVIVAMRQVLYGLDKASGDSKWKIENNWFGTGELLTPILANGYIFYGVNEIAGTDSLNQTIALAEPSSGKTLKTISMPGNLGATPTFHGECLFVKDYQSYRQDATSNFEWVGELRLNCVDLDTGKIIWTFQGNGVPATSQISFSNGLVFDVFANQLYAIDESSGVLKWQSSGMEAAVRNPQVIEGSNLLALEIPVSNKTVFLDSTTGKLQGEVLLNVLSPPIFTKQEAIYGTTNALVRVDISTGDIIWSIPVDSQYQVFPSD